jgi:hypothetical protein
MQVQLTPAKGKPGSRVAKWKRASHPRDAESQLKGQDDDLSYLCDQHGYVAVHEIVEHGISGQLTHDRRAINRVLAWARAHEIDGVIARDKDRISRGYPWFREWLEHELAALGVWVQYFDDKPERDKKTTDAVLMDYVEGFRGLMEWCTLRDRIMGMMNAKARAGFMWGSNIDAYGWRWHDGGEDDGYWTLEPAEWRWVRQMYEWYDQGHSLRAIARMLTEERVPSKTGAPWWPETIRNMLENEKHTGIFRPHRWEAVPPTRPYVGRTRQEPRVENRSYRRRPDSERPEGIDLLSPDLGPRARWFHVDVADLVPRDQWERIQAKLKANRDHQPVRTRPPTLLDGLVWCARDHGEWRQYRMRYRAEKGRRPAWRCKHRADYTQGYCRCRIAADVLEEAVWAKLLEVATDPAAVLHDMLKDTAALAARAARASAIIAKAEAEVRKQVDAAARLRADYAADPYDRAEFDRALALIETRRKAAEQNVADARAHVQDEEPSNVLEGYQDWQRIAALVAGQHGPDAAEKLVEHALDRMLHGTSWATCTP